MAWRRNAKNGKTGNGPSTLASKPEPIEQGDHSSLWLASHNTWPKKILASVLCTISHVILGPSCLAVARKRVSKVLLFFVASKFWPFLAFNTNLEAERTLSTPI